MSIRKRSSTAPEASELHAIKKPQKQKSNGEEPRQSETHRHEPHRDPVTADVVAVDGEL